MLQLVGRLHQYLWDLYQVSGVEVVYRDAPASKDNCLDADDPGAGFEASAAARAAFITETELTLINELVEISGLSVE